MQPISDQPTEPPTPPSPGERLAQALRALRAPPRPAPVNLAEQVAYLERDLQEVRTRVNALFFAALTATIGPLIARLI